MIDENTIQLSPEQIIYRQIERIHLLRANGMQALESLKLLSSSLKPLRTPEYDANTKRLAEAMKDETGIEEAFYTWYESLIDILSSNGYWLVQRRYLGWEE